MSNVEENYLDNLLKNVMEPHPVEPREREQTEKIEEEMEHSTIEEEPILEELIAEEPITEEPVQDESLLGELMIEEPKSEEPVLDESLLGELMTEEPILEEPVLEESVLEESVLEESLPEELLLEEAVSESLDMEATDFSLDELGEALSESPQVMEQNSDMSDDELDLEALEKELDLGAFMTDMPEMTETEDSIDLAALEELLGSESGNSAMESEAEPDIFSAGDSEIKLDEIDEDILKDIGALAEESGSSEAFGEEDDFNDVLSLLSDDDSELAEINDLLKKSDTKEPVQDDMMALLSQMADDEEKQFAEVKQEETKSEQEVLQTKVETVDESKKAKKQKKAKASKKQKVDEAGAVVEKKPGVFAKLFRTLTEEFEPEPTEEELAKEAEEKAAAKQAAKAKKEEDKKAKAEENKVKAEEKEAAKKAKAEADAQKKREKQEAKEAKRAAKLAKAEAERPKNQKRISPKKMVLVTIFAASILAVVLLFTNFITKEGSLQRARKAYYEGNYQIVYVELYGSELDESDALVQARSKVILKMQRKYDSYVNHMKMGQDVKALNALIEGLRTYDTVNMEAEQYGVMAEVDEIKTNILNVLDAKYGIDEATARELLQNEDEISYTKSLNHIIMGNSSDLVSNL